MRSCRSSVAVRRLLADSANMSKNSSARWLILIFTDGSPADTSRAHWYHMRPRCEPVGVRPGNYAEQARTYDETRRASPTILAAVRSRLGPPVGRRLVDVAGGTGNYAAELHRDGFRVIAADAEPAMLHRAGGRTPLRHTRRGARGGAPGPLPPADVPCARF